MKSKFWQRLWGAVSLAIAMTACFAVISVIIWVITAAQCSIIGG